MSDLFTRAAFEAIREDQSRIAKAYAALVEELATGCCQHCGAPFITDALPGVRVVSYSCNHSPVAVSEYQPDVAWVTLKLERDRKRRA